MSQITITFSTENSRYLSTMVRITGLSASTIVNRAMDMKRDVDDEFISGFKALMEKFCIPDNKTRKFPTSRKYVDPDEYAKTTATEVYEAEENASYDLLDDFNNDDDFRVEVGKMKKYATR